MKKLVFGIFAHPDDEAFGPSGALLAEKAAGNEVHLICVTKGQNGTNPDNVPDLGAVRLEEWRVAGELIGADSMHNLGFMDGELANNLYFEVASRVEEIVSVIVTGREDIGAIEFMSLDLGGFTGHLDHIFVSRVACYVFYKLKATDDRYSRVRLACLPSDEHQRSNINWLYMDAGRTPDTIDETIDARAHLEKIDEIMRAHHSQRSDYENVKARHGDRVGLNYFVVLT